MRSRSGGGSPLKPSQARGRQLCASTPGAASRSHRENGCSPWVQLNASGQRPPCSLRHTALRPLGDLPPTAEQPMGSPPTASLQVSFHYAGRAGVFPSIVCKSSPSTKALRLSKYGSPCWRTKALRLCRHESPCWRTEARRLCKYGGPCWQKKIKN